MQEPLRGSKSQFDIIFWRSASILCERVASPSFKFCNFAPVFDGSSYTEELTSRWSTCIWNPYQTRTSQVLLNFSPLAARAARRWLTKRDPLQGLWVSDAQTCGELWWNALFLSVASPLRTSKTRVKLQSHNAKWKCRGVKLQFLKISCNPFAQNEGQPQKSSVKLRFWSEMGVECVMTTAPMNCRIFCRRYVDVEHL